MKILEEMDRAPVPPAKEPRCYSSGRPSLCRTHALTQIATDIIMTIIVKAENREEARYIATLVKNAVEWQF